MAERVGARAFRVADQRLVAGPTEGRVGKNIAAASEKVAATGMAPFAEPRRPSTQPRRPFAELRQLFTTPTT